MLIFWPRLCPRVFRELTTLSVLSPFHAPINVYTIWDLEVSVPSNFAEMALGMGKVGRCPGPHARPRAS